MARSGPSSHRPGTAGSPKAGGPPPIPTRADWGDIDEGDLDARSAFESFFGKSLSGAEALFERNALFYQEELQAMPAVAFRFYVPALAAYLVSPRARGDADGASSFLHMVRWMLESNREMLDAESGRLLLRTAERIAMDQEYYRADPGIYGSFAELYAEVRKRAAGAGLAPDLGG